MTKTLIINPLREETYYLKFLVEGITDSEFSARESLYEVLNTEPDILNDHNIIIVTFNIKGFSSLLERLYKDDCDLKVIITYTDDDEELIKSHIRYNPNIYTHNITSGQVQLFESSFLKILKIEERQNKEKVYCKVRIDYFLKFDKLVCDVFLKLSDKKYLKIINRHQAYDHTDIQKYIDKDINHLYIKEHDFKLFVSGLVRGMRSQDQSNLPVKISENTVIPLACQETVHEMVHKLGLTTEALILTNEAINMTMDLIQDNNLKKLLQSTLGSGSYISEISMLSNYIACAICKESEWSTGENYLRLSIASFFQNISLDSDEHARIDSTNSPEYSALYKRTQKKILEHPSKSVQVIEKIKGLPIGVDKIILTHHEKYDGSGFPRGLDYSRLESLSAIFIVALEMSNIIYETGFQRDIVIEAIQDMEEKYTKGSFAKVIAALKVAFAVPLVEHEDRKIFA